MTKSTFYLAKNNINGGIGVYREPPTKLFRVHDANVCWDGRSEVRFYALEKFISALDQPPATCMKVEVEGDDDMIVIKVLDRNFDCKVSYS